MDEMTLHLSSPITDEQMDAIMDVDFDCTNWISFHTKHGRDVSFVKTDRVIEILKHRIIREQDKAKEADGEGRNWWARAYNYAELLLGRIVEQIRREEAADD